MDIVTAKRLSLTDILRAFVKKKKQNKNTTKEIVFRANESGYSVLYKYTSNHCHDLIIVLFAIYWRGFDCADSEIDLIFNVLSLAGHMTYLRTYLAKISLLTFLAIKLV